MKKLVALAVFALAACGSSSTTPDAGTVDAGLAFTMPAQILAYLEGKTFLMEGDNIPPYPLGYSEDVDYGAYSQCYISVSLAMASGNFNVTSALGTIEASGDSTACNHTKQNGTAMFTSTTVLVENVKDNASCFDITINYGSFGQEGRGKISPDGKTLTLELYFSGQATGHRCADGDVGAQTVKIMSVAFTNNAQQVYVLQ